MKHYCIWFVSFVLCAVTTGLLAKQKLKFSPEKYVAYRTASPLIIDGKLADESWEKSQWTKIFVDIEGNVMPIPFLDTKAKMLWDDRFFYFGFEMEEPHLWATLTQRDTIIYYENDIEVFIDPDGDTHQYYELEVNALGTEWDLLISKPYRDPGNSVDNQWDIDGLITTIHLDGTLNDPSDLDQKWTVEIAIPWQALDGRSAPSNGTQWRVNFSRVHWDRDIINGQYKKQNKPAYNWVWSPQGLVNMHYPEMWGFVQFSDVKVGQGESEFEWNITEDGKWALRQIYYAQRLFKKEHGTFTPNYFELKLDGIKPGQFSWPPIMYVTSNQFTASIYDEQENKTIRIREDGKVWIEKKGD